MEPRARQRGAALAALTLGEPAETAAFCAARAPAVRCLSDPTSHLYELYGLRRATLGQAIGPRVWPAGLRALARGHVAGRGGHDPLRLSGSFVIDPAGRIVLAHYAAHVGDLAATDTLLDALHEARAV